jgi:hypothetical protein
MNKNVALLQKNILEEQQKFISPKSEKRSVATAPKTSIMSPTSMAREITEI